MVVDNYQSKRVKRKQEIEYKFEEIFPERIVKEEIKEYPGMIEEEKNQDTEPLLADCVVQNIQIEVDDNNKFDKEIFSPEEKTREEKKNVRT